MSRCPHQILRTSGSARRGKLLPRGFQRVDAPEAIVRLLWFVSDAIHRDALDAAYAMRI